MGCDQEMVVPVNVSIQRFYRCYVHVQEGAAEEEVKETVCKKILEEGEAFLVPDTNLEIEEDDIGAMEMDWDATWSE